LHDCRFLNRFPVLSISSGFLKKLDFSAQTSLPTEDLCVWIGHASYTPSSPNNSSGTRRIASPSDPTHLTTLLLFGSCELFFFTSSPDPSHILPPLLSSRSPKFVGSHTDSEIRLTIYYPRGPNPHASTATPVQTENCLSTLSPRPPKPWVHLVLSSWEHITHIFFLFSSS